MKNKKVTEFLNELTDLKKEVLEQKKTSTELEIKIKKLEEEMKEIENKNAELASDFILLPNLENKYHSVKNSHLDYHTATISFLGNNYGFVFEEVGFPEETFFTALSRVLRSPNKMYHIFNLTPQKLSFFPIHKYDVADIVKVGNVALNSKEDYDFIKKEFIERIENQNKKHNKEADIVISRKNKLEEKRDQKLIEIKNLEKNIFTKLINHNKIKTLKEEVKNLKQDIISEKNSSELCLVQVINEVEKYVEANLDNLVKFTKLYNEAYKNYQEMSNIKEEINSIQKSIRKIDLFNYNYSYTTFIKDSYKDEELRNALSNYKVDTQDELLKDIIQDIQKIYEDFNKNYKEYKEKEIKSMIDNVM